MDPSDNEMDHLPFVTWGKIKQPNSVRPLFGRSGEGEVTVGSAIEAANQAK